jgi:hypothetical protein
MRSHVIRLEAGIACRSNLGLYRILNCLPLVET